MTKNETSRQVSAVTLHQLIEKQAALRPSATAVSYNNTTISYKELNERANQLAHHLQCQGVQQETFVGISVERSIEMIIGVLGILKAGGTYIPVDPHYPKERIRYMLSDSGLSFLITQQSLLNQFSDCPSKKIVLDADNLTDFPTTNPEVRVSPDSLAYVLYTSGSTGNPKGVMVSHANIVSIYESWEKIYQLTPEDCHLQMANFSFDVFTGDLARALGSGGRLVLCPRHTLLNPKKLYNLMLTGKINCAEFVPTVLRRLVEHIEHQHQSLDFMRLLICGSDNWSMNEYRQVRQLCSSSTRVINSYGLTEATIDSTYFEEAQTDKEYLPAEHSVPLGKPFPNTEVFLLDETGSHVPDGTVGEIIIGGSGLARGYLNKAELTAQRFILHPLNPELHTKLYKTGDQGRRLPDGNIEFLGRIDNQVKLRGMRIELSDIENTLNRYPGIRESLVMVNEDNLHHKKLVAYFIVETGVTLNISDIRQFSQQHLPHYMVPSYFIKLDALPLTPNGKLDRQALKNNTLHSNFSETQFTDTLEEVEN